MAYLFRQKLQLQDLVNMQQAPKKVLIYEPESYLADLYKHYLRVHNFDVKHCPYLPQLRQSIVNFSPQLLVYGIKETENFSAKTIFPINFQKEFPDLMIVTTGYNISNDIIKAVMNFGVSGHINRRLSRPQDLAIIVKTLFNN